VRSVLVVKTAAIGDCVNALGAVRALRAARPDARVGWLIGRAAAAAVVDQVPVDDWIVVDDAALAGRRPHRVLALALRLRRRRFDAALVLHRARAVRWLVAAAGIPRRVGLVRSASDRMLLTDAVVDPPATLESERYWRAAERLVGHALARETGRWTPPTEAAAQADALWSGWGFGRDTRVVAMAPGGGVNPRTRFPLKRWPVASFVALARRIVGELDARVLILGLPEETAPFGAEALPGMVTASGDLRVAGALLARADVCVANDGGLLHLAAAAGTPTVGIFGPTDPMVWGAAGRRHLVVRHVVPCQPCYKDDGVLPVCRWDHRCMRELDVEEVLKAVTRQLAGQGDSR
jgi:ADP-heptose:LPS heptosyltransferase